MLELKSCSITGREKRGLYLNEVNRVCLFLKRNGLFVYDVTQSLTAPSEYNLLVEKECTTC